jgi:hypothetical protein
MKRRHLMSDTTASTPPVSDALFSGNAKPRKQIPNWLPEKFWDAETGEVRLEALAKSYAELERKLNAPANVPTNMTDNPLGSLPDGPHGYELNIDDVLESDDGVNQRLFDAGFTNDQAQLVYDLAKEHLLPLAHKVSGEVDDVRQLDHLAQHFGGADRFDAVRPQLRAWAEANLKPEVLKALGSSAEGVIAIHSMMQNREPGLSGSSSHMRGTGEADLKRMMADPRYWRDRDPTYVAQVREGFRQLYPES